MADQCVIVIVEHGHKHRLPNPKHGVMFNNTIWLYYITILLNIRTKLSSTARQYGCVAGIARMILCLAVRGPPAQARQQQQLAIKDALEKQAAAHEAAILAVRGQLRHEQERGEAL